MPKYVIERATGMSIQAQKYSVDVTPRRGEENIMTGARRHLLSFVVALILSSGIPAFAQTVQVGQPAPDFAVTSLAGETTIRLSDFRGRRVLIFHWATW